MHTDIRRPAPPRTFPPWFRFGRSAVLAPALLVAVACVSDPRSSAERKEVPDHVVLSRITGEEISAAQRWVIGTRPVASVGGPNALVPIGGEPSAALLLDGSAVVADPMASEVRRYDVEGREIWGGGRRGKGPGEYQGVDWVGRAPDGRIAVWSSGPAELTFLSTAGEFLERIRVVPEMVAQRRQPFIGLFRDGSMPLEVRRFIHHYLSAAGSESAALRDTAVVRLFDRRGAFEDTIYFGPGDDRFLYVETGRSALIRPLFGATIRFAIAGNSLFAALTSTPVIWRLAATGDTLSGIELDVSTGLSVSRRAGEAARAEMLERIPASGPGPFRAAWEETPVSERYPTVHALAGTREGLWIGLFQTEEEGLRTWIYVNEPGLLVGVLHLPLDLEILDSDGDHLLTKGVDELGRWSVHLWPLSVGGE